MPFKDDELYMYSLGTYNNKMCKFLLGSMGSDFFTLLSLNNFIKLYLVTYRLCKFTIVINLCIISLSLIHIVVHLLIDVVIPPLFQLHTLAKPLAFLSIIFFVIAAQCKPRYKKTFAIQDEHVHTKSSAAAVII